MKEQRIDDSDMHDKVIAAVEKAIADAEPPRPFRSIVDGLESTRAPFEGDKTRLIAERLSGAGRTTWQLRGCLLAEPDIWCFLSADDSEPGTARWWPGNCDLAAAQYLAWWEGIVEIDESAQRLAGEA